MSVGISDQWHTSPATIMDIRLGMEQNSSQLIFLIYFMSVNDLSFPLNALVFLACLCVCVCVCVLLAQLCLPLHNPTDCSPSGFSVHGILQARILEWVAISFSRGSSWPRDWTLVSCIAGRFFTIWATKKALKICKTSKATLQGANVFYFEHFWP